MLNNTPEESLQVGGDDYEETAQKPSPSAVLANLADSISDLKLSVQDLTMRVEDLSNNRNSTKSSVETCEQPWRIMVSRRVLATVSAICMPISTCMYMIGYLFRGVNHGIY